MKKLILILPVLLTGCVAEQAIKKGAEVNDSAVDASVFTLCSGASVGSIRRNFGAPDKAQVWRALCNGSDQFDPAK